MNIEDLIILLAIRIPMNSYDSKLINSFHDQISRGNGFTEKQSELALKILRRQKSKIEALISKDITTFLDNPVFRLTRRTVNNQKHLSIVNHNTFGKAIKAQFPYNESLVQTIRQKKSNLIYAQWDGEEKAWIFSLDERNLEFLLEFTNNSQFTTDSEIADYFNQIQNIKNNFENHVPMVSYKENSLNFLNAGKFVPQPNTNDVLEALFLARRYGIHTWDDTIDKAISDDAEKKVVLDFLNSSPSTNFELYLENTSIFSIQDIVKYLTPCVFIIPGGSEIEKIETSLEILKNIGVNKSEVSVLFRLPKETGEKFNIFVKENGLNNPVNENTKAIFISSKVPKTIIEPKIKFNSVINFNFYNVHYTIREFIKNHHNVVTIFDKKPQRTINFANL